MEIEVQDPKFTGKVIARNVDTGVPVFQGTEFEYDNGIEVDEHGQSLWKHDPTTVEFWWVHHAGEKPTVYTGRAAGIPLDPEEREKAVLKHCHRFLELCSKKWERLQEWEAKHND